MHLRISDDDDNNNNNTDNGMAAQEYYNPNYPMHSTNYAPQSSLTPQPPPYAPLDPNPRFGNNYSNQPASPRPPNLQGGSPPAKHEHHFNPSLQPLPPQSPQSGRQEYPGGYFHNNRSQAAQAQPYPLPQGPPTPQQYHQPPGPPQQSYVGPQSPPLSNQTHSPPGYSNNQYPPQPGQQYPNGDYGKHQPQHYQPQSPGQLRQQYPCPPAAPQQSYSNPNITGPYAQAPVVLYPGQGQPEPQQGQYRPGPQSPYPPVPHYVNNLYPNDAYQNHNIRQQHQQHRPHSRQHRHDDSDDSRSDSDTERRRRRHERQHRRTSDNPSKPKEKSSKHKDRFLGASAGALLGDLLIAPGVGTAAGALLGGLSGDAYSKKKEKGSDGKDRYRSRSRNR
ncbi:MAG: hypothetical protein LQ340_001399 [Diploschistes diacapsis]|nr:MAG: hypothetical protein LQ340_001399 [Diploschistes diacapsis]